MRPAAAVPDAVDVGDVLRTLRRHWRAVITVLGIGVLGAVAVILFAPRRFDGTATLLLRPATIGSTSIVGRLGGGVGDLLGSFGGGPGSAMETELQVLRSRSLARDVIDSLQLHFQVRQPAGVPANALVAHSAIRGSFAPRDLRFERRGDAYVVQWDSNTARFVPGQATLLDIGSIKLRATALPDRFVLRVLDEEDAAARFEKHLQALRAGGEVASITYRGDDSLTAAAVPNALIAAYLARRHTVDRGVNLRRVEYVSAQMDSTAAALTAREHELRRYLESTGVIDPEQVGKVDIERASVLRKSLTELEVDEGAMRRLLAQASDGRLTSRELAAYPIFLSSAAVSPLVSQLSQLETERIKLLELRTERDPEVLALDSTMAAVEANIAALARTYATAVSTQRAELSARLDLMQKELLALPAAAERSGRLKRDVLRLSQIYTALEAQLVEARLAAIGEGGEVRQIDFALPPRKPAFPKPLLTLGIGAGGGLVAGIVTALLLGLFGRWLRDPVEIERLVGVNVERLRPGVPLFMTSGAGSRSLMVVPLASGANAGAVAERLAHSARRRALPVTIIDVASPLGGNGTLPAADGTEGLASSISALEQQGKMVIIHAPQFSSDDTIALLDESRPVLLVAPPGPVDRVQLSMAVDTLRRLNVPCAGLVISDAERRSWRLLAK